MSVIAADTIKARTAGAAVTTSDGLYVGGGLNVSGITTVGTGLSFADDIKAKFGNSGDLAIYHDGSNSYIEDAATGSLKIGSDGLLIQLPDYSETMASFTANGAVDLYYNDTKRFETHNTGVKVTGIATISSDLNVAGISTVGILTAYDSLTVSVWTLGASGTDHYTFTGPGDLSADTDPDLQLIRGQRYIFENRSGGHPFRIQSTVNGSAGTAYNDGVTNNDAADGTDLVFDVPFDAPPILYYQCTSHNNMGGAIYVGSSSGDNVTVVGVLTATEFVGGGSGLTGLNIPSSFTELDAMLFN